MWCQSSFEGWRTGARIALIELEICNASANVKSFTELPADSSNNSHSIINPRILIFNNKLHFFVSRVKNSYNYDIAYASFNSIDDLVGNPPSYRNLTILDSFHGGRQGPTNPAPFIGLDGLSHLIFRDSSGVNQPRALYHAKSSQPQGPYKLSSREPLLQGDIEDPYVWSENGHFKALIRDIGGSVTGLKWPATGLIESPDGITWAPACSSFVCGRKIPDKSDEDIVVHRLERPSLLFVGGCSFLFFGCLRSPSNPSFIKVFKISLAEIR